MKKSFRIYYSPDGLDVGPASRLPLRTLTQRYSKSPYCQMKVHQRL